MKLVEVELAELEKVVVVVLHLKWEQDSWENCILDPYAVAQELVVGVVIAAADAIAAVVAVGDFAAVVIVAADLVSAAGLVAAGVVAADAVGGVAPVFADSAEADGDVAAAEHIFVEVER